MKPSPALIITQHNFFVKGQTLKNTRRRITQAMEGMAGGNYGRRY